MWFGEQWLRGLACVSALGLAAPGALGASLASDNASDSVYDDGWDPGDNGGFGLGPWSFSNNPGTFGSAGQFIFTSTNNGDGNDDGNTRGAANDFDIDTLSPAGARSWGMFANGDASAIAIADRPLTGGELSVGQSLSVDMDNGFIDSGSQVGVYFGDGGGDGIGVLFTGGTDNYALVFGSAGTYIIGLSSLEFADEGLSVTLTRTGTDSGELEVTLRNGESDSVFTSFFMLDAVTTVSLVNANAGFNASNNAYFNSIAVTPEPTSMALLGAGALVWLRRRR